MKPVSFCLHAWKSWPTSQEQEGNKPVPTLIRRRITPVGQQALSAAWQLPDTTNARFILSSRHGEFSRTFSLLQSIVAGEDLSPADFTLSVHHALVGLLSIVQSNHRGHIAIASGQESFCYGLMEAAACLQENPDEPVLLVHFDDLLQDSFAEFNETGEQPIALALFLTSVQDGDILSMDAEAALSNPKETCAHAQAFIDFISTGAKECISIGETKQWRWSRHA